MTMVRETGDRQAWLELLDRKPVFSTHEHHMEAHKQQGLRLNRLFQSSYVGWCKHPPEDNAASREEWLDGIRSNTYFTWLEKAICRIYGVDRIESDNWDALSDRIGDAHRNADWHTEIMKRYGKYEGFIEDCYWDSGSDVGLPEFATPVYRLDMWIMGYHAESLTNDGASAHELFAEPPTFDQYLERFEQELRERRQSCVGLKCASAYQRSIAFRETTEAEARAVFGKRPAETTQAERDAFGDFILWRGMRLAEELELPVQFHTGLAKLSGSSPMNLEPVIAAFPRTRIVLFHGGFPWIYETAGLVHNYGNLVIDINWLPLISTSAASNALGAYIDVLTDSGKISWGGDTWTGEEAVGASMALRHILAKELANRVSEGLWTAKYAERFADKLMAANAKRIYFGQGL